MKYRTFRISLLVIGAILLTITGLSGGLWLAKRNSHNSNTFPSSLIPTQIMQKVSFPIYAPAADTTWKLETARTSYDQQNGVLTLYLTHDSAQIILTQQGTPQVFSDVPQQYSKMLATMNEYAELQTPFGAVGLTHPKELNGGQTAVVNKTGTLLFAKPNRDLSDAEWKEFFNNLQIYK